MVAKTKKQNSATPFMLRRPEPNSGGLGSRTNNGIDTSLDYLGLELVCTCKYKRRGRYKYYTCVFAVLSA
jgi:hypothetical protein